MFFCREFLYVAAFLPVAGIYLNKKPMIRLMEWFIKKGESKDREMAGGALLARPTVAARSVLSDETIFSFGGNVLRPHAFPVGGRLSRISA